MQLNLKENDKCGLLRGVKEISDQNLSNQCLMMKIFFHQGR
jgi:hypothetical protein